MATGLNVSDVVNVTVTLAPQAVGRRNFGSLLIAGASSVIDTGERVRLYTTSTAVASDYGISAPEYLAAQAFFAQAPQPAFCYLGRWAGTATHGVLRGAALTTAQQQLSNFTGVTSGGFGIVIDGTTHALTTINLSGVSNLNGVATAVQTALTLGVGTVTWDATRARFSVKSATSGITSTVGFATAPGSGTDISSLLGLSQASGASQPVAGIAAETPVQAVQAFAAASNAWYGLMFADTSVTDNQHLAVSDYIEAASPARIYGITTQESTTLDPASTTDIAYELSNGHYSRTVVQYSSANPYAIASLIGRAFTVDFTATNTAITLKFKQEPTIQAETLSESGAASLLTKHCNVFVNYANSAAIIQEGVMANGDYFDERQGIDWFANAVQTDVFNLLYTSPTKIPQTDPGVHQIVTTIEGTSSQAVSNGLLAPGVWGGPGFGQLQTGDTMSKGFYVWAPSVSTQSAADRAARKSPPIQVAAKLAGAVHYANVLINVVR